MGRSRFVHRGLMGHRRLFVLALCLAACGISEDELLVPSDVTAIYEGGGSGKYGIDSEDPASFGVIQGKVLFQGRKFPGPRKLDLGGKAECVNKRPDGLLSEDFLIGAGNELGGVIVYVKRGVTSWPSGASAPAVLDQIGCRYVPHLLVVRTGQEIRIKSSDPFLHNVRASPGPNNGFNRAMSGIGEFTATFNRPEMAKRFGCDVHGWMVAHVAVLPHPLHAITGPDGSFKIEGVPPGRYQLGAWHEKLGEITLDVAVKNNETITQEITLERQ